MQLWTDYEGITIDGAYPLQKLLMPEGRSAFYSTAGLDGEPTVVRLIECHFDEEEILSRWRCVEALNHPNFLKFEHFGQTEIDGRPVVYAVLEKVDANLAEVLDQGSLPTKDIAQLATSLVAALEVLHTHGFIHEHVEPRNIFALNDTVKLRSDCIREAPEGEEGRAAKQRDVRDLASVLLQGLTQRTSIEGISDSALPVPFNRIIRKGLDDTWGLDEIKAALEGQFAPKQTVSPNWVKSAPPATAEPMPKTPAAAAKVSPLPEAQLPLPLRDEARSQPFTRATPRQGTWTEDQGTSLSSRWRGVAGIAAALLILLVLVLARSWSAHRHEVPQSAAVSESSASTAGGPIASTPAPEPVAADAMRTTPAATDFHAGWRVIAFTYNRRQDAEKKAAEMAHRHPQLAPAVFNPSGHAPYFVSIGGVMNQNAAYSLARRSRSLGLPRDTFARNYSR